MTPHGHPILTLKSRWVATLSRSRCPRGSAETNSSPGWRLLLIRIPPTGLVCPTMPRRFSFSLFLSILHNLYQVLLASSAHDLVINLLKMQQLDEDEELAYR